MQTAANNSAKFIFDRASITLKLHELEYLMWNLTTLANRLARYKLAEADVLTYAQSIVGATSFVPPPKEQACIFVQFDVLFEDINKYLFP
jgi:argininosuccinate lyase